MKTVTVQDVMQGEYSYILTEPEGKNFHSDFHPELTPKQMLEMGVFGGKYLTDGRKEFPVDWFTNAKFSPKKADPTLNFFGITASKPLSYWKMKDWIHPQDPRGWFQWYCRYYVGRRSDDDKRQIKRWRQMVRHIAQVKKHCMVGDLDCRKKQRQALLHWAYDSRLF